MDQTLKRINELAKKAKTAEGLTLSEQNEQKKLRQEYIKNFRGSLNDILLNSRVIDPEGNDVTPEKLIKAQQEKKRQELAGLLGKNNVTYLYPKDTQ